MCVWEKHTDEPFSFFAKRLRVWGRSLSCEKLASVSRADVRWLVRHGKDTWVEGVEQTRKTLLCSGFNRTETARPIEVVWKIFRKRRVWDSFRGGQAGAVLFKVCEFFFCLICDTQTIILFYTKIA